METKNTQAQLTEALLTVASSRASELRGCRLERLRSAFNACAVAMYANGMSFEELRRELEGAV